MSKQKKSPKIPRTKTRFNLLMYTVKIKAPIEWKDDQAEATLQAIDPADLRDRLEAMVSGLLPLKVGVNHELIVEVKE